MDSRGAHYAHYLRAVILFACGLLTLLSCAVLAFQAYDWAKTGSWPEIPASLAFEWLGYRLDWIRHPSDWVGLARVAAWLLEFPLALWAYAIACAALAIGSGLDSWQEDVVDEAERRGS